MALMSDDAVVVAYIKKRGHSFLSDVRSHIGDITLAEQFAICLTARYTLGRKNVFADQLSYPDQVLQTEWFLLPWVFEDICKESGHPLIDLFTTRANLKLLLYLSLVPNPMAWKDSSFQHSWDILDVIPFHLFFWDRSWREF